MQGGRNPNRFQKKLLNKNGKDGREWLYIKITQDNKLIFKHKETGEVIELSATDK